MNFGKKRIIVPVSILVLLAVVLLFLPAMVRTYWRKASANPVRLGVAKAAGLGCFQCHGPRGSKGIPDPGGEELEVPSWSGGMWMMYVKNDEEIREFILEGVSRKRASSGSARKELQAAKIHMPAFGDYLRGDDLENLVAAFKVLSGMVKPPGGTPARQGYDLSRKMACFACHGAGGSGGLPNPGSFTGFIPGWYGKDFEELVRSREEFDRWVKEGKIERLEKSRLAGYFMHRQRIKMPAYSELGREDLDALWAYVEWLDRTGGGTSGE